MILVNLTAVDVYRFLGFYPILFGSDRVPLVLNLIQILKRADSTVVPIPAGTHPTIPPTCGLHVPLTARF